MTKPTIQKEKFRKDMQSLENALWKIVKKNAEGLKPSQIIDSLKEITDEIYDAGIGICNPNYIVPPLSVCPSCPFCNIPDRNIY